MVCGEEDYARKVWVEGFTVRKGTFISKSGVLTAEGSYDLYTVPSGKKLYITSAFISGQNIDTDDFLHSLLCTGLPNYDSIFFFLELPFAIAGQVLPHDTSAITFPSPIKVTAGTIVRLYVEWSDSCYIRGGIIGYVI